MQIQINYETVPLSIEGGRMKATVRAIIEVFVDDECVEVIETLPYMNLPAAKVAAQSIARSIDEGHGLCERL